MNRAIIAAALLTGALACSSATTVPAPKLTGVSLGAGTAQTSSAICNTGNGTNSPLLVRGDGFLSLPGSISGQGAVRKPTVRLEGPRSYELPEEAISVSSATLLVVQLPARSPASPMPTGSYDLVVANPGSGETRLGGAIQVGVDFTVSEVALLDHGATGPATGLCRFGPHLLRVRGNGFSSSNKPLVVSAGDLVADLEVVSDAELQIALRAATPRSLFANALPLALSRNGCAARFLDPTASALQFRDCGQGGQVAPDPAAFPAQRDGALELTLIRSDVTPLLNAATTVLLRAPARAEPNRARLWPLVAWVTSDAVSSGYPPQPSKATLHVELPACSGGGEKQPGCAGGIAPGAAELSIVVGGLALPPATLLLYDDPPQLDPIPELSASAASWTLTGSNLRQTGAWVGALRAYCWLGSSCVDRPVFCAISATALGGASSLVVEPHYPKPSCYFESSTGERTAADPSNYPEDRQLAGTTVLRLERADGATADFDIHIAARPGSSAPPVANISLAAFNGSAGRAALTQTSDDAGSSLLLAAVRDELSNPRASYVTGGPLDRFGQLCGVEDRFGCHGRVLAKLPSDRGNVSLAAHSTGVDGGIVYAIGGENSSQTLGEVLAAQVLRRSDIPDWLGSRTVPGGLQVGGYFYRVAAVFPSDHPTLPGAAGIASPARAVQVNPSGGVELRWRCVPGASGYRVYRAGPAQLSSAAGRLADIPAPSSCTETIWTDAAPGNAGLEKPNEPGGLGPFLPAGTLQTPRANAEVLFHGDDLYVIGGCGRPCDLTRTQLTTVERATLGPGGFQLGPFATVGSLLAARVSPIAQVLDSSNAPVAPGAALLLVSGDPYAPLAPVLEAAALAPTLTFSDPWRSTAILHAAGQVRDGRLPVIFGADLSTVQTVALCEGAGCPISTPADLALTGAIPGGLIAPIRASKGRLVYVFFGGTSASIYDL